jgi:cyclase
MLTSMDADGTLAGYDIPMTKAVTSVVGIPVIASGGAGSIDHIADAFILAQAQAALISSIVHYGQTTIGEIKRDLAARGLPVRLT